MEKLKEFWEDNQKVIVAVLVFAAIILAASLVVVRRVNICESMGYDGYTSYRVDDSCYIVYDDGNISLRPWWQVRLERLTNEKHADSIETIEGWE